MLNKGEIIVNNMNSILQYIINLIVFVPITIILIIVSIKISKVSLVNIGANKYVKVIEKTSLNKDTDVFVLKIGEDGCVIVASNSKLEKIKELSEEEIFNIEEKNKESKVKLSNLNNNLGKDSLTLGKLSINKIKSKLKEKKDGKLS